MSFQSFGTLWGLRALAVSCVAAAAVTAQGQSDGQDVMFGSSAAYPDGGPGGPGVETGFNGPPIFKCKGPGVDFIKVGVTTRVAGVNPPQLEPFTLIVPPLPSGCDYKEAFINWNFLHDVTPPPPAHVITVNGVAITGFETGSGSPDLCWGRANATGYVAPLPPGLLTIGGPNVIGGATDGFLGATSLGEGVHILVIYECPGGMMRNVEVYCGYTSTETGVPQIATVAMPFCYPYPGPAVDLHLFLNALDGQTPAPCFADDFFINGIPASGLVAGTGVPGDAWQGFLGHLPVPFTNWLHDHANDDIRAFMPLGPSPGIVLDTARPAVGDCIGHSFGAVSYPVCESAATVTTFNCGTNPPILTATPPQIGGTFTATIGASPKGHALGLLLGYSAPLTVNLGPCRCLLVDITLPELFGKPPVPLPGTYSCPVPCDPTLCGFTAYGQAALFGGGVAFALTNRVEMTAGY